MKLSAASHSMQFSRIVACVTQRIKSHFPLVTPTLAIHYCADL